MVDEPCSGMSITVNGCMMKVFGHYFIKNRIFSVLTLDTGTLLSNKWDEHMLNV